MNKYVSKRTLKKTLRNKKKKVLLSFNKFEEKVKESTTYMCRARVSKVLKSYGDERMLQFCVPVRNKYTTFKKKARFPSF